MNLGVERNWDLGGGRELEGDMPLLRKGGKAESSREGGSCPAGSEPMGMGGREGEDEGEALFESAHLLLLPFPSRQ